MPVQKHNGILTRLASRRPVPAMAHAWKHFQRCYHADGAQAAVHPFGLIDRNDGIVRAVEEEKRRVVSIYMRQR